MKPMKQTLAVLTLSTLSATAFAHSGHGAELPSASWLMGLTHPLTGLDHLLAMLGVGLWATTFQGKLRFTIPATFVGMMLLGFAFGANGGAMPMMEQGIATSVLVIGLLIAWAKRLPAVVAMVIVGAFALFHGVAHGVELQGNAWQFGLGFVASTVALHIIGMATGNAMQKQVWLTRAVGGLMGVAGLTLFLA